MDWIERWCGIAPDNGDGSLEILILVGAIAAGLAAAGYLHPRTRAYLANLAVKALQLPPTLHR
jgi:hypothetical protein